MDLYRNRAVTDLYEPGSVMKVVTMSAAVDLGLVTPNTTYDDTGTAYVGGYAIQNWDFSVNGTTTMTQLLQKSLNTGAVWVSQQLGPEQVLRVHQAIRLRRADERRAGRRGGRAACATDEDAGLVRRPTWRRTPSARA